MAAECPIRVNYRHGDRQTVFIFVGLVPKSIRAELTKLERTPSTAPNPILRKFYGPSWKANLAIDRSTIGGESEITEADIESLFATEEPIATTHQSHPVHEEGVRYISDIVLLPEDNILEFKRKLSLILGVPLYQICLEEIQRGPGRTTKSSTMGYSVFVGDVMIAISMSVLQQSADRVDELPVLIQLYDNRQSVRVEAYDQFRIIDKYSKRGILEYNVYSLADFIPPASTRYAEVLQNKMHFDLVYSGFILPFWPMVTPEIFRLYLNNPSEIKTAFVEIAPEIDSLRHMYQLEANIVDVQHGLFADESSAKLERLQKLTEYGITYATLSVIKFANINETNLSLRNLFDRIRLTQSMPMCVCRQSIDLDSFYIFEKYFTTVRAEHQTRSHGLTTNSLMLRIYPDPKILQHIDLIIYTNGNYIARISLREEGKFNFADVTAYAIRHINPILTAINKMPSDVMPVIKLPFIDKTSRFTEINMSIFYRHQISVGQFNALRAHLDTFKSAGICRSKSVDSAEIEVYFCKGMFQHDHKRIEKAVVLTNYYENMTNSVIRQKWFNIFEKTRTTKFIHRFSDLRIEVVSLKEKEFEYFYRYIMTLLFIAQSDMAIDKTFDVKKVRTLKSLKEQDPVLYDFKKIYRSDIIYSKICQRPYQPQLLTPAAFEKLPRDQRATAVKYWNFTTNQPAYYSCPDPKYPFIKFIVGKHPKKYCIPCCKKLEITDDSSDTSRNIYNLCLRDREYDQDKKTLASKYIMSYGKQIDEGRISRLPENSLEPLFYETYSADSRLDQECMGSSGYYLFGIPQTRDLGYLFALTNALEMNVTDLLAAMAAKLRGLSVRDVLGGQFERYFATGAHMAHALLTVLDEPTLDANISPHLWNELFIELAYIYFDVNTIMFEHTQEVVLLIPPAITQYKKFVIDDKRNILILRRYYSRDADHGGTRAVYYPIYSINVEVYSRTSFVDKRLFASSSMIIHIIQNLVKRHLGKRYFQPGIQYKLFDLHVLGKFIDKHTEYKFVKLFVNSKNLCYAALLIHGSSHIHISLAQSSTRGYTISQDSAPFIRSKYDLPIMALLRFIRDYRLWNTIVSSTKKIGINNYPNVEPEKWVVLRDPSVELISRTSTTAATSQPISRRGVLDTKDRVIAFMFLNNGVTLNFYFNQLSGTQLAALKLAHIPLMYVRYDPDTVNSILCASQTRTPVTAAGSHPVTAAGSHPVTAAGSHPVIDRRAQLINDCYYRFYLYPLLMAEFVIYFRRFRNEAMRKNITKLFSGELSDVPSVMAGLVRFGIEPDLPKLRLLVANYFGQHHNRTQLLTDFKTGVYTFDMTLLNAMYDMPIAQLRVELNQIAREFTVIRDIKLGADDEFPNLYQACSSGDDSDKFSPPVYCDGKKLIIPRQKLNAYIDILANDLRNPMKRDTFFLMARDPVVDFLKFSAAPHEVVYVSILRETY